MPTKKVPDTGPERAPEAAAVDPADRKYFVITEEQWKAMWEMLDLAIAKDMPALRKLMKEDSIWGVPEGEE